MKKYFLIIMFLFSGFPLYADVKINEIVPKGSEWVELYNTNSSPVSLDGWQLIDDEGDGRTLSGTISAYGFDTVNTSGLSNSGDLLFLVNAVPETVDQVGFGIQGGAPLAHVDFSLARITDGLDTDDDARDFNIDWTPTPESPNNPAGVSLGSSILINEIRPYPTANGDSLELYNPTGTTYDIKDWVVSDGDDYAPIVTDISILPSGYLVLVAGEDFYLDMVNNSWSGYDVCYLFNNDSIRVDQLGWAGEFNDFSFQRYPDGAGPNDGYDWISSGGGVTLFDTTATWGASNIGTGIEEDFPYGHNLIVPGVVKGKISIQYAIPVKTDVAISIVDGIGRLVSVLVDEEQKPGYYSITVEKDNLPSGLYFVIMESPLFIRIEKLMFIR